MTKYNISIIKVKDNHSKKKNELIAEARKSDKQFFFLVQDDIKYTEDVFEKYIDILETYEIACSFYGFYKTYNRLFNGKANPIACLKIADDEYVNLIRKPVESFICFDLFKIPEDVKFNENLKSLEFDFFLHELSKKGIMKLKGFYIDIFNSWEYFNDVVGYDYKDVKTINDVNEDRNWLEKNKLNLISSPVIDEVLDYVKEKRNIK